MAHQGIFSSSHSSGNYSNVENFAASQAFRLPDATSDFVGDWCGWSHLSSCDPPGTCDEESGPTSLSFKDDAGWLSSSSRAVTLQYSILTQPDAKIEDIQVHALNPRHVQVTFTERRSSSSSDDVLINRREDIVSVNTAVVRYTGISTFSGASTGSVEDTAEMRKCSHEFEAAQQEYMERKNLVEKGEVTGQVPNK
jgi:hypothetical protein